MEIKNLKSHADMRSKVYTSSIDACDYKKNTNHSIIKFKDNKKNKLKSLSSDVPVWWIEALALASCLIGIFGLLALLSQETWSDEKSEANSKKNTETAVKAESAMESKTTNDTDPATEPQNISKRSFSNSKKTFQNPFANKKETKSINNAEEIEPSAQPLPSQESVSLGGDANPNGIVTHGAPGTIVINDAGEGSNAVVTDFNFPDADILEIAKTLGKLTGKNFIFDKNVKGRITIVSNSPITIGDAWRAFLTALEMNNYTLVPSGKYIQITKIRDGRDKNLNVYTENSPAIDSLITRVFSLKYITPEEVARTFRSFLSPTSRIIPYAQTNTLIVTDTGTNIDKLAKMLEFLDVEGHDAGIEVIPVRFASAGEIATLIDTLLPGTSSQSKSRRRIGKTSFEARSTKEGGVVNNVIADERTNTLIVHANAKGVEQVQDLVSKLDQKIPARIGGGKIRVIYLQFADAEKIAQTISGFSASAASTSGKTKGGNPLSGALFQDSIKVTADKSTNSLVITASPSDFVTLQRVIAKLDIPLDEVFVETIIMETAVSGGHQFAAGAAFPGLGLSVSPGGEIADFVASPIGGEKGLGSKGLVVGFQNGQSHTFSVAGTEISVKSVMGLIKAIKTHSNTNVLATPQILTLDNQEAIFEATEQIPVPSVTMSTQGTTTSIDKQNITLSVKIKPNINKISNFVKLDIKVKIGDISGRELPSAVKGVAYATTERNSETTVVVADGDTVILGGLTRDRISESVSKVPLLGDIPILGWLFSSRNFQKEKLNTIIFLTPHIIRQYEKVRQILEKKLADRDTLIEEEAEGDDYFDYKVKEIRESLPDVGNISWKKMRDSITDQADAKGSDKIMDKMKKENAGATPQGTVHDESINESESDNEVPESATTGFDSPPSEPSPMEMDEPFPDDGPTFTAPPVDFEGEE